MYKHFWLLILILYGVNIKLQGSLLYFYFLFEFHLTFYSWLLFHRHLIETSIKKSCKQSHNHKWRKIIFYQTTIYKPIIMQLLYDKTSMKNEYIVQRPK
jgi:hypothetical protein